MPLRFDLLGEIVASDVGQRIGYILRPWLTLLDRS